MSLQELPASTTFVERKNGAAPEGALAELVTFFEKGRKEESYRQADLHERSLFPLAPQILGLLEARAHSDLERAADFVTASLYVLSEIVNSEVSRQAELSEVPPEEGVLEEVGVRLLTWLKLHLSAVRGRQLLFFALTTVGQCAHATWESLAAILNAGGFLVFCKECFGGNSQQATLEETEELAECVLTPLRAPRGVRGGAAQIAVKEALTKDGMLTWVFERAGRGGILPTYENENLALRKLGGEFNRVAGHVHIVEAMLCGSRRGGGGNWDPGYLADVRAAVSRGTRRPAAENFMTFCEAEGVPVFASLVEERNRLERFRARAELGGHVMPEAADVARRVDAVWELVADAFSLHKCANFQACSRVEDQKGVFMRCGRCKSARYCSRECQRAHWLAGHKWECQFSA
ncbi:hypothetical protein KFL_000810230 [Klebsormidium nitens]|uniref:phytol kinase n=1 Tax=Klebsormidium nitens TaxID=105231 RepID=A0A1Y1HUG9_KLENI|nr:hypothetical protein KFL_000810230 [Klebsormidium nitens]|eukprot:GAQ81482.1 hypothetical protein KFL_000810230 [Klebsormidium nitens]